MPSRLEVAAEVYRAALATEAEIEDSLRRVRGTESALCGKLDLAVKATDAARKSVLRAAESKDGV